MAAKYTNNWVGSDKWTVRTVSENLVTDMAVGDKLTFAGKGDAGDAGTLTRKHITSSLAWANTGVWFPSGATWAEYITLNRTRGATLYYITYVLNGSGKPEVHCFEGVDPTTGPNGAVWTADDQ